MVFSGSVVMGIGSMVFTVPHFIAEPHLASTLANSSSDNICRGVSVREQDMGLGRLSSGKLTSSLLTCHNNKTLPCSSGCCGLFNFKTHNS